jgi:taurine dioxygenase
MLNRFQELLICEVDKISMKGIDIEINANSVGVNVKNFDLSIKKSPEEINYIHELINKFRLVILKNQVISDDMLCGFLYNFGPPFTSYDNLVLGSSDGLSNVVVIGNKATEYEKSYLSNQEVLPHSDHQWLRYPSSISALYAIDVDDFSASTIWTDMIKAYESLDTTTKGIINDLKLITYNPFYRPFGSVSAHYVDSRIERPPGEFFLHPLVRTHPVTFEKILYLHEAYEMELDSVEYDFGANLINRLHSHVREITCKYEHKWEKGDIVIWDNKATIHYRRAFDKNIRRVLKRVSIGGGIPF